MRVCGTGGDELHVLDCLQEDERTVALPMVGTLFEREEKDLGWRWSLQASATTLGNNSSHRPRPYIDRL